MTKSPGHLIAIAFIIAVLARLGAKYLSQFSGHTGFLGYTHLHKAVLPVLGLALREYKNGARRKTLLALAAFFCTFAAQSSSMNWIRPSVSGNIPRLYIIKTAKWFMLTMPILMLYYKDMGFTTEQAFRLKAIYSIAIVLFEIPSGYLADILGRKTTLLAGGIFGTLGFVIYATTGTYLWFILAEVTLGIGQSLISGADSAMLYDTLQAQKRQNQYTRYEGINTSVGNFAEAL